LLPRCEEEVGESTGAADMGALVVRALDLSGVGNILLVEDVDPVRLFAARALHNKGYGVIEVKNGDIALEALRDAQNPIDLIISDVVMAKRDGPTLIREVSGTHPDMKVIFISGCAMDDFL
jgi:two-component system cell cycle sensor histidine kinase/response regulator CckA